jgi:hypothetical protein
MRNYHKEYDIPTTASLCASCLGILLIIAIRLSIIGGVLALIYLAIKWLIQNT